MTKSTVIGAQWEKEVFGRASHEYPYTGGHEGFQASVARVKRVQHELEWSPSYPKTEFARELMGCVKSYLPCNVAETLRLYSAIGTSLDYYHGADGFFEITVGSASKIVFIDLTTNGTKTSKSEDIVVVRREDSYRRIWRVGQEITRAFKLPR